MDILSSFIDISSFPFLDIFRISDKPWEIVSRLQSFISSQKEDLIKNGYKEKSEGIIIGKNVTIEEGSKIVGPALIGNNSKIGHTSYIRPGTVIGENVQIGHGSEVKNSLIFNNSAIAHLNYIGDSIIGNNVNIAGGVIVANWRFDKKNILLRINGERIDTGLEKFGSIIGDNSNIGVNSVLNPGTIFGKNCIVFPLTLVSGYHKDNSIVK